MMWLVTSQKTRIYQMKRLTSLILNGSTLDYLGCSPEFFKVYIEHQMKESNQEREQNGYTLLTWENITIDHIKPIDKFDLEVPLEFVKCCNYSNLQPLLQSENRKKGFNWSEQQEQWWCEKVIDKSIVTPEVEIEFV